MYRCDRETRGGEVLIALANNIISKQLHNKFDIEMVTVELIHANVTLSCLHVAPNAIVMNIVTKFYIE